MRRLPSLLLSFAVVPAAVVAGPVVSRPAPAPHAVPAQIQEIELEPALSAASLGAASPGEGPRTIVATEPRATAAFSTLGVTWATDPQVGDVTVVARTRTGGVWTDWIELDQEVRTGVDETVDTGPGVRAGTEPAWVDDSDGVQVKVQVLSGRAPADLRLSLIDPGSSAADAVVAPTLGGSLATAATSQPVIRSRSAWGADESIRRGSPSYSSTIQAVTLHHTASSNSYAPDDVPGILRGFYAFHVQSRGWSDIGYNVLVDKYGTAWEGRAGGLHRPVIGSHAGGFNTDTAGISLIGTYEDAAPPPAMFETVARVGAWKLSLHNRDAKGSVTLTSRGSTRYPSGTPVTLPRMFGHRDVSTTSCPGRAGYSALPNLRERTAALIAAGPATPPPDPFGSFDEATPGGEGAQVRGWAIDPDAGDYTRVEVRVDGQLTDTLVAKDPRPDVAAAYPDYSPNHGFNGIVALRPGTYSLCVTAKNQNDGSDRQLGCRTVEIGDTAPPPAPEPTTSPTPPPLPPPPPPPVSPVPFGEVDEVAPEGTAVRVRGWVIDPDAETFSSVQVSVDGAPPTTVVADRHVDFLVTAQPTYSPRHGFDALVPAAPGERTVCLTGVNQNQGHDLPLGCATVTVQAPPPPPPPPAPVQPEPAGLPAPSGSLPPPVRATDDSCPAGKVPGSSFRDIVGSVHADAISCVVWWQVAGGVSATSYAPAKAVTRAQMATFLARTIEQSGGSLPASPPDAFGDDNGSVHERAINQLAAVDISRGKGGRVYDPAGNVTRAQMASFLTHAWSYRTGRAMPLGADYFHDDNGNTHEASIGRAARAGFTSGVGPGQYGPNVATDRAQMATFLARLLDLLVEAGDAKAHA